MLSHVIRAARAAASVHEVLVATDNTDIAAVARCEGVQAIMTDSALPSGTDRVAAALDEAAAVADVEARKLRAPARRRGSRPSHDVGGTMTAAHTQHFIFFTGGDRGGGDHRVIEYRQPPQRRPARATPVRRRRRAAAARLGSPPLRGGQGADHRAAAAQPDRLRPPRSIGVGVGAPRGGVGVHTLQGLYDD